MTTIPVWQEEGLCRRLVEQGRAESWWWFCETARARVVCCACPYQKPCRDWARERGEVFMWGGETALERMRHNATQPDWPDHKASFNSYTNGCRCPGCSRAALRRHEQINAYKDRAAS